MTGYLRIIPTEPSWVPDAAHGQAVRDLLKRMTPQASAVTLTITDGIEFVDPGENFDRILCPGCGSELDEAWWQDRMEVAYDRLRGFVALDVVTPCCGCPSTLNQLHYTWPCGFARMTLESEDYDRDPLTEAELDQLAACLGSSVRQIFAHY